MKLANISLCLVAFTIVSCSGGGGGNHVDYRQFCADYYKGIPSQIPHSRRMDLDIANLPAGNYKFEGGDFWVTDNRPGKKDTIVLHVRETVLKNGKSETSSICSRGLVQGMDISYSATGISDIEVFEGGKSIVTPRDFTIDINRDGLERNFKPSEKLQDQPPSKVFDPKAGVTKSEVVLFRVNKTRFEIRSVEYFGDDVMYVLRTIMTYSPPTKKD